MRFNARVKALGYTLPEVFKKYDVDKTGQLTQPQVSEREHSLAIHPWYKLLLLSHA